MAARGPTTPGTGAMPMSVVWTAMTTELVDLIFDKALPRQLDMMIEEITIDGAEVKDTATGKLDVIATPEDSKNSASAACHKRASFPDSWKVLSSLTSISKVTRKDALRKMEQQICVHAPVKYDRRSPARSMFSNWIRRCNRIKFASERFIAYSSGLHPILADSVTALKFTFSIATATISEPDILSPETQWQINLNNNPSASDLLGLLKYMRKADAGALSRHPRVTFIAEGRLRSPRITEAEGRKSSELLHQFSIAQHPHTVIDGEGDEPRHIRINPEVPVGWNTKEDGWKEIDVQGMERLVEDVGRREMLGVLWVFLPYLQPEGAQLWELDDVNGQ